MKKLKKIDMHVHCIEERGIPKLSGHFYPTVHELRKIYDEIGIERGVLLPPGTCPEFTTERLSPREAEAIAKNYNDTIGWWFCGVDPRFGSNNDKTDFSHYLNYYKSHGAKGVSELISNISLDDPRMLNLFKHCEACGMSVTLHFGKPEYDYGVVDELHLPKLEKILQTFPNLTNNLCRNQCHIAFEVQSVQEIQFLTNAHPAKIHNANTANRNCTGYFR